MVICGQLIVQPRIVEMHGLLGSFCTIESKINGNLTNLSIGGGGGGGGGGRGGGEGAEADPWSNLNLSPSLLYQQIIWSG